MTDRNKEVLIRRYVDEVWNQGKPERMDDLGTADFTFHGPSGALQGQDFRSYVASIGAGFQDGRISIDALLTDGDMGCFMWTLVGTNTGEFMGAPATGKKVEVPGTSTLRFEGDKLAEAWSRWDRLLLMEQLGLAGP